MYFWTNFSVEVVKQQLDVENLGIITKTAFLNEFYPGDIFKKIT